MCSYSGSIQVCGRRRRVNGEQEACGAQFRCRRDYPTTGGCNVPSQLACSRLLYATCGLRITKNSLEPWRNGRSGGHRPEPQSSTLLSAQTHADRRKWAVKADGLRMSGIDTGVHCAEEKVGTIAKANFGIGIFHRNGSKPADIGHNHGA